MTLAMVMILVGGLLVYCGIKGYSIGEALRGHHGVPSSKPAAATRSSG